MDVCVLVIFQNDSTYNGMQRMICLYRNAETWRDILQFGSRVFFFFLSRVPLEDGYSSAGGLDLTERMTV